MPFLMMILCAAGLAVATHTWHRQRELIGTPLEAELANRMPRRILAVTLLVLGGVFVTSHGGVAGTSVAAMAGLGAMLAVLSPAFGDRVCGTEGVRAGWSVRSFAELEEWRLTGDHLRFRLRGVWTAVPLAADQQPPIRATLEELVGDRESSFDR